MRHIDVSVIGVLLAAPGRPVLLDRGDQDWAQPAERVNDRDPVSGALMGTVDQSGYILVLNRPDEAISKVRSEAW